MVSHSGCYRHLFSVTETKSSLKAFGNSNQKALLNENFGLGKFYWGSENGGSHALIPSTDRK